MRDIYNEMCVMRSACVCLQRDNDKKKKEKNIYLE